MQIKIMKYSTYFIQKGYKKRKLNQISGTSPIITFDHKNDYHLKQWKLLTDGSFYI